MSRFVFAVGVRYPHEPRAAGGRSLMVAARLRTLAHGLDLRPLNPGYLDLVKKSRRAFDNAFVQLDDPAARRCADRFAKLPWPKILEC